jgi:hypothetical protein
MCVREYATVSTGAVSCIAFSKPTGAIPNPTTPPAVGIPNRKKDLTLNKIKIHVRTVVAYGLQGLDCNSKDEAAADAAEASKELVTSNPGLLLILSNSSGRHVMNAA